MKKRYPIDFFLTLLPLLSFSCENGIEKTRPKVERITESVYASGTVKTHGQYQVYAAVNGLISDIFVNEGDTVKKGDPLIRIQSEQSVLNAENARLTAERADIKANADKLKQAKVAIDLALTKMKNDSMLLVRQRNLNARGVGTLVELEQRELAYKNSLTNYEVALINYRDLKKDLTYSSNQSKINLQISKSLANDYFVRSASNGKVYKVLKEKGEMANTTTPLAIVGEVNRFEIELDVDEYDVARIAPGQRVLISMDSYRGQTFEAKVEEIEPLMNPDSRSFTVTAGFVKRPPVLYPNLSVEANIIVRVKDTALTIPRSYLISDSLVLIDKGKTRKVEVGIKDYQKAEVIKGLSETDVIYKPAL